MSQLIHKHDLREPKDDIQPIFKVHKLGGLLREVDDGWAYKQNWVKNSLHLDFSKSLAVPDHLQGTLLKGIHLITETYDDIGHRFMGDIDILVQSDQIEAWCTFLKEKGFEEENEVTWQANDFKRVLSLQESEDSALITVELHTRLFYEEPLDFIWQTKPSPFQNLSFLSNEDLFIHLCGHLAYQHTFLNLHWLYDIALFLKSQETLDWIQIKNRAKKLHVYRSVEIICFIMNKYFELPTELEVKGIKEALFKTIISKRFLCDPTRSRLHYLMAKIICKDGLFSVFKYQFHWVKAYFLK